MARPVGAGAQRYSVADYEQLADDDAVTIELVQGFLVREPAPGAEHGRIQTRIARLLDEYAEAGGRGVVLSNAGFLLVEHPPTVRAPGVAFIARSRAPSGVLEPGFWRGAPDLAVEINSPSNTASDTLQKVSDYLDAGVRLVWVVDPPTATVTVYRSRQDIELLPRDSTLDGGVVLPGLRLTVADLLG
jgi:Uma2 family endonuclease